MPLDSTPHIIDTSRYETVTTKERLSYYLDQAREHGYVSFDTETTGLDPMTAELVGFSLCVVPGESCYVPVGHEEGDQLSLQDALELLKPILENACICKIMQNGKYDINVLHKYGVGISYVHDTMLMSNSMYGGLHRHNMDELSARYLGHTTIKITELIGKGSTQTTFDKVDIRPATAYAAEDSDVTLRLFVVLKSKMASDQRAQALYDQIEHPLIAIISDMERRGIKADVEHLRKVDAQFGIEIEASYAALTNIAGEGFNPASPQQVGALLQNLGVPLTETTDSGQPATGAKILEDVADDKSLSEEARTFVKELLKFRKFAKLRGTYTQGLQDAVNQQTGRVHPSFGLASTTTGRLACSEPNLQNIPIRTPEGKLLRQAFIAEKGHKLIAADYSQIELRVVADVAGDEGLLRAFADGVDIHTATASLVWGIPLDKVDSDTRRNAKAVNFGIVYGTTSYGLARNLGVSEDTAAKIISDYFEKFPGIRAYMTAAVEFAKAHGYVETMAGRKIWLPDIAHSQKWRRGHAERAAINAPIQGTAADIIKGAMSNVYDALTWGGYRTRMLLQVHDELVFEAPEDEVDIVMPVIKQAMEESAPYLSVPLLVEIKQGDNWLEAH